MPHTLNIAWHTVSTIVKPSLATKYKPQNHRIYDSGYWQKKANDIQERSPVAE